MDASLGNHARPVPARSPRKPARGLASPVVWLLLSLGSTAQTLPSAWQAHFDGPAHYNDYATSVDVMASGKVAVGGTTWVDQPGVLVPLFFVALYSPQGQELWSRTHGSGFYGGNGNLERLAVAPGDKIVAAGTRDLGADWMVVQYDASGAQEWEGLWLAGSSFVSSVADLDVDTAGNIYLCGNISSGAGVAKFSAGGALLWSKVYTGTGPALGSVRSLAIGADGNVFLTGSTATATNSQLSVARIDAATGAPLWVRHHGPSTGFDSSGGTCIVTDGTGHAIAAGRIVDPATSTRIAFFSYASDGTLAWSYDHLGPTAVSGLVSSMDVDEAGNIAAAGEFVTGAGDDDGFVLRMSGSGLAWQRTFGGAGHLDDSVVGVGIDDFGNVYAGGFLREPAFGFDAFRYDASGNLIAHGRSLPPTGGSGRARDLAVSSSGRTYVVGDMATFPGAGGDALTAAFVLVPPGSAFCPGDGSGTACPCGNSSPVGANAGCLSSVGLGGKLVAGGLPSLSHDTFVLQGTQMTNSSVLYFQGTQLQSGGVGLVFGDGLRCVNGTIVRLSAKINVAGASSFPVAGDASISSMGHVTAPGLRTYQGWYRNSAPFCGPSLFNMTNGWQVTWSP
jgi:hypothetical protein